MTTQSFDLVSCSASNFAGIARGIPHRWMVFDRGNPSGSAADAGHDAAVRGRGSVRAADDSVVDVPQALHGAPSARQLRRNELLNLTTIVPATDYHRSSYAERYSRYTDAGER
jgi:hypothetical protein